MIALIRNKQGEIIPCKAIKGKITDITKYAVKPLALAMGI